MKVNDVEVGEQTKAVTVVLGPREFKMLSDFFSAGGFSRIEKESGWNEGKWYGRGFHFMNSSVTFMVNKDVETLQVFYSDEGRPGNLAPPNKETDK